MAKSVYDIIKKQNGEGFARVLRNKNLLDIPDIANIVKYAGHTPADAEQIFPYLWSLKEFTEDENTTAADPFQLLDQAGYHAFEVHNLDEQNSIKRFFRQNEELCTFRDVHRYENNYIIHAIKHDVWRDVNAIKPSKNPQRQDEYGTSVISIQIRKDGNFISIKNRYNHTVNNPDQTFNSNPDEIISGLSAALKGHFHIDWKSTGVTVPNGFILFKNKILKINFEIYNWYFGDGFYAHNGHIIDIDKNNQIQMDYFIWDNKKKELLNPSDCNDGFPAIFNKFIQGKQVTISGKAPNQTILVDGIKVIELENNQIISLNMPGVTNVNFFLYRNLEIRELNMPDLKHAGNNFLSCNVKLTNLNLPNLISAEQSFMLRNQIINTVNLPRLQTIGYCFMHDNRVLSELNLPAAQSIKNDFLFNNASLQQIHMDNVTSIGDNFLTSNTELRELNMPQLKSVGNNFLDENKILHSLNTPKLEIAGSCFLDHNLNLQELNLPNLTKAGGVFLAQNEKLNRLYAPRLEYAANDFLSNNTALTEIDLPSLKFVGHAFLDKNTQIQYANLPNLERTEATFLRHNKKLKRLSLPKLTELQEWFLQNNNHVILDVPNLNTIVLDWKQRPATGAVNTPITDIITARRNIAQRFRHAIKQIYDNIKITYQTHDNRDI